MWRGPGWGDTRSQRLSPTGTRTPLFAVQACRPCCLSPLPHPHSLRRVMGSMWMELWVVITSVSYASIVAVEYFEPLAATSKTGRLTVCLSLF